MLKMISFSLFGFVSTFGPLVSTAYALPAFNAALWAALYEPPFQSLPGSCHRAADTGQTAADYDRIRLHVDLL